MAKEASIEMRNWLSTLDNHLLADVRWRSKGLQLNFFSPKEPRESHRWCLVACEAPCPAGSPVAASRRCRLGPRSWPASSMCSPSKDRSTCLFGSLSKLRGVGTPIMTLLRTYCPDPARWWW